MKVKVQGRRATDKEKETLSLYSGFGGIKEVLNMGTDKPITGDMAEPIGKLQRLIDEYPYFSDAMRKQVVSSIKASVLTAFYTPQFIIDAVAQQIQKVFAENGLIPSSKGYRFYVDDLLTLEQMSENEISLINNWYATKVRSVEEIFRETSRIISQLTKNVSLVLAPQLTQTAFQYLRFLPLNEHQVIAVIMTDAGFIDNKIIDIPSGVSFEDFDNIASIFNHYLKGKRLSDISMASIRKIRGETVNSTVFNAIINIIDEALAKDKQERLYLGGARELMEQPEFHNIDKVKKLLSMFEEKQLLYDILHAQKDESLAVTIGQENKYNDIKDCSIISATYHLDGKPIATLAVLGPTRMDYGKIISLLKFMNANLADIFHRFHL